MIDFDRIEYMAAVWYVRLGHRRGDWMAALFRERGDDRWLLKYRFRYYMGAGDPFSGEDTKNWYAGTSDGGAPEDEEIAKVDFIAGELAKGQGTTVDRVEVRGDVRAFMEKVAGRSWIHVARAP
jgi:hypothetical protein